MTSNKEWQCTCTTCYNCRVNQDRESQNGAVSSEDKNAEASKAVVAAAKEYRESFDNKKAVEAAYVRVKPSLDRAAAHDRGEITIAAPDLNDLILEGDPMERMVCDSCQ